MKLWWTKCSYALDIFILDDIIILSNIHTVILETQFGRAKEFCFTLVFFKCMQNYLGCRTILQSSSEPIEPPRQMPRLETSLVWEGDGDKDGAVSTLLVWISFKKDAAWECHYIQVKCSVWQRRRAPWKGRMVLSLWNHCTLYIVFCILHNSQSTHMYSKKTRKITTSFHFTFWCRTHDHGKKISKRQRENALLVCGNNDSLH